ncbi:MAG: amidase [Micromonosporaceae bacterium]
MTWVGMSAVRIAAAVRAGEVSAAEVVADHLAVIDRHDETLAAFRVVRRDEALAEARELDARADRASAPLSGVPIAVKENTAVAGLPTWNGSAAARSPVATSDHEVVRRLRAAGAIVVGVTRMPELGLWAFTDDDTAVTRNPWQLQRTPGGSSGGSAAAVAAGLVPIAHANDGLGSVRIPAACCGLVGIKPTRGLVPCQLGAEDWFGLTEHGILATTVADAALGLAVLADTAPDSAPPAAPGRLRIAVSLRSPVTGVRAAKPNRRAVAAATRLLTAAGHQTRRADPTYPMSLEFRGTATWFAAAFRDAAAAGLDRSKLQPRSRRHVALGEYMWRHGHVRQADRDGFRSRCLAFFADGGHDLLLTPVVAGAVPEAARWSTRSWRSNITTSVRFAPFAAPWNISGLPALAVPLGTGPDGLPLSVQLVGPPGAEGRLLAVAAQIEAAQPWPRHAPGWPRT